MAHCCRKKYHQKEKAHPKASFFPSFKKNFHESCPHFNYTCLDLTQNLGPLRQKCSFARKYAHRRVLKVRHVFLHQTGFFVKRHNSSTALVKLFEDFVFTCVTNNDVFEEVGVRHLLWFASTLFLLIKWFEVCWTIFTNTKLRDLFHFKNFDVVTSALRSADDTTTSSPQ